MSNITHSDGPIEWGNRDKHRASDRKARVAMIAFWAITIVITVLAYSSPVNEDGSPKSVSQYFLIAALELFCLYKIYRIVFSERVYLEYTRIDGDGVLACFARSQNIFSEFAREEEVLPWSEIEDVVFNWQPFADGVQPAVC